MNCPQCGAVAPPDSDFCGECGTRLPESAPSCSKCGSPAAPGDAFCQSCGNPLGAQVPAPPAAAPPPPPEAVTPPPPPPSAAAPPPPAMAPPPPPQYQAPPPPPSSGAYQPPAGAYQPSAGPQGGFAPPPSGTPGGAASGQGGGFLVPAGYVLSLIGGLLGMAVGGALWQSKIQDPSGRKVPKYSAAARRHGIAMMVLGGVAFGVSTQIADQINLFGGDGGPPEAGARATGSSAAPTTTPTGTEGGAQPSRPPATGGIQPSGGGAQPSRPTGGGAAPASLGLSPNAAPANDFEELVLEYLNTAYEINLQEEGFGSAIHRQFGSLGQDQSEDVSFRLPEGADIAIFGTCDNECSDLNFMLFSEDGRMVDQDNMADDIPLVVVETGRSVQRYTVRVEMASCSIAPCYYALGVYRR